MIYSSEHQVIAESIYRNELKWGLDFIPLITSNRKENREKGLIDVYFSNKNEAFRKAELFIDVINDLQFQRLIILHKHPDKKIDLNFILKEPQNEERDFEEFHKFFNDYLTLEIEPQSLKLKKFKKQCYLDEITFWRRRSYKTNYLMAFCIILLSVGTLVSSIYFNKKVLTNTQKIMIDNQNKLLDSLTIKNPVVEKALLKIDSTLRYINQEVIKLQDIKK